MRDEIDLVLFRRAPGGTQRVRLRAMVRQRAAAPPDRPARAVRIRKDLDVVMSGHDVTLLRVFVSEALISRRLGRLEMKEGLRRPESIWNVLRSAATARPPREFPGSAGTALVAAAGSSFAAPAAAASVLF